MCNLEWTGWVIRLYYLQWKAGKSKSWGDGGSEDVIKVKKKKAVHTPADKMLPSGGKLSIWTLQLRLNWKASSSSGWRQAPRLKDFSVVHRRRVSLAYWCSSRKQRVWFTHKIWTKNSCQCWTWTRERTKGWKSDKMWTAVLWGEDLFLSVCWLIWRCFLSSLSGVKQTRCRLRKKHFTNTHVWREWLNLS